MGMKWTPSEHRSLGEVGGKTRTPSVHKSLPGAVGKIQTFFDHRWKWGRKETKWTPSWGEAAGGHEGACGNSEGWR